jgi:hypothetical protein
MEKQNGQGSTEEQSREKEAQEGQGQADWCCILLFNLARQEKITPRIVHEH